jgi:hypothetical protein
MRSRLWLVSAEEAVRKTGNVRESGEDMR